MVCELLLFVGGPWRAGFARMGFSAAATNRAEIPQFLTQSNSLEIQQLRPAMFTGHKVL